VQHIGAVNITPGMTVLQAIASAGGLTPYANGKKIYILRGPQGSQKRIPFNYKVAIRDGNQQGVTLVPGDTIVVP
jgi:polysaccharide export outer membrane protein